MRCTTILLALVCGCGSSTPPTETSRPTLDADPTTSTEVELPGIRVTVPDWPVKQKDDLFSSGQLLVERAPAAEQIQLAWVVGIPESESFIANALAGMKSGGVEAEVVRSYPATVSQHSGTTYELRSTAPRGLTIFLTYWHCAKDERQIQLRSILLTEADHRKVVDSVKCHTGTPGRRPSVRFAGFDPPPGMKREAEQADRIVYSSNAGVVILLPGVGGSIGRGVIADSPQGRDARARLLSSLTDAMMMLSEQPVATHFTSPKQPGATRHFASAEMTVEALASVVVMTFVHCEPDDTVFPAAFLGLATTPRKEIVSTLMRATCPE